MPDAPNSGSNRRAQPAGLGNQVAELLPTPTAVLGSSGPDYARKDRAGSGGDGLQNIAALLPTPTTEPETGNGHARNLGAEAATLLPTPRAARGASTTETSYALGGERSDDDRTQGEVVFLPTPVAKDADGARRRTDDGEPASAGSNPGTTLTDAVTLLPTPSATLMNDSEDAETWKARYDYHANKEQNPTRAGMPLPIAVQMLPTPLVSDVRAPHPNETERDFAPQLRAIDQLLDGEGITDLTADGEAVAWGKYRAAIKRAEMISGRLAPTPTLPDGRAGKPRLAARFVEWMMMLLEGHVTGRGLSRANELARLGNGVVPIQAAVATASGIHRLAAMKRGEL